MPRSSTRKVGRRPSPISASCRSRAVESGIAAPIAQAADHARGGRNIADVPLRNAQTASVDRAEGSLLLLIELIVAAFLATYVIVVAVGHIILMAAIYKCPREDSSGGRGRRAAVRPQIAAAMPVSRTHERLWSRNGGEPI